MRTGAIFARGTCRALKLLKWLTLVGLVVVMGSGVALAQPVPDTTKGGGDGVEWTITPSAAGRFEGSSITLDVTLHATVPASVAADVDTTVTLVVVNGPAQIITTSPQTLTIDKHSAGAGNAESWSDTATFQISTQTDAGGEDDTVELTLTLADPYPTSGQTITVKLNDRDTQSFTLDRPTADRSKAIRAGGTVNLELKSTLPVETATTYSVTTSDPTVGTVGALTTGETAVGSLVNEAIVVTVGANASNGDTTRIVVTAPGVGTGAPARMVADYLVRVGPVLSVPSDLTFTPATQADITVVAGTAITATQLPTVTAGVGTAPYTYTAKGLPAGLAVAPATGMLIGTPTTAAAAATVTYTATDSATPAATGSLTFTITVTAAGTTPTPTTGTDGVITAVVVGDPKTDAPVRTIGGVKRVHVTEGTLTKLTVTGRWTHEQLAALYAGVTAPAKPAPATVMVQVTAATGNDWLSPAEIDEGPGAGSSGGKDVVLATHTVEIAIPAKPTTNVGSPLYTKEKSGSISLSLPHDVDAEDEGFMVEVVSGTGVVTVPTRSMLTTDPPVIVIEDDEIQGIVLTTDPASTTTATTRLFEGSSAKFKAVAKPAREDLPLQVRYDVTTLTGVSVSSRLYTLTESGGYIPVGTGAEAKDNVTLGLPANDGDRVDEELQIHAEVVSFSLNSGAFDDIETSTVNFTAVDVHKLPELTVSPSTGTVKEGGEIELTLMIDRNPANTTVSSTEKLEYTNEEVTVMLTMGAGSTAGATDFSTTSVKFAKRTKGLYTDEMKVKVMALADDEIDGGEMLVLDAMLKGSETKNGAEGTSLAGVTTLTIEDATQKLVYAKTPKEVEDAVYAAKKAAEGDDEKFTPGEMMEVMGSALFSAAEGVTVSYTAMSSAPAVASASVSGGTVTVTAATEGMADITITAHAMSPSGVKIVDQTDPDAASIMFPVEVGLEALSIELTGPEDMNLVEGGMGGMVTATANRAVTEAVTVMLMRDRAMSSADDMDFEAEPIMIEAGMMTGSTMVTAVADDMMENDGNMAEELVLYGMTENNAGAVTGEVKFYLWDAAVPALPVIAQLLLAALLGLGGYRRYLRR